MIRKSVCLLLWILTVAALSACGKQADGAGGGRIKVSVVEDMISPGMSGKLAGEMGAAAKNLYHRGASEDKTVYIDRMRANLKVILDSLAK